MTRRARVWTSASAEAAATLRRHPLRAALAGTAMAVAVATAAIVQTSLDGLAASARETSERAFGSDSFLLTRLAAGTLSRRELALRSARNPNITRSDLRFLERVGDGDVVYAASVQRTADVSAGGRLFENASINGTQATLPDIRDIALAGGRFVTPDEDRRGAAVAVLGSQVAEELFAGRDPVGESIRLGLRQFQVVGVQAVQGTAGGQSLDRIVYIPLRAFERVFGAPASLQVFARGDTDVDVEAAEDRARVSMRARRHLAPGAADTFDLVTPEAARSFVTRLTTQVSAAGPPVTFMALLAAIIVVANTTLVSVSQRTHEIGLRRAIGATRRSVVLETLVEAMLVGLAGGAAGLLAAAAVLGVASVVADLPLSMSAGVASTSLAAAGVSGLVAGWYPARRAASIDPVEALRNE